MYDVTPIIMLFIQQMYICQIEAQMHYGGVWKDLSATMPYAAFGMAVGYLDGIVKLIGGCHVGDYLAYAPWQHVISFDLQQQIFTNITPTGSNYGVLGISQYFTQLNESVYMIQIGDDRVIYTSHISRYDLSDDTFNASFIPFDIRYDYSDSCLASSNDYLFLIGNNPLATSSVYQFSTNEWFHANLTTARHGAACTVYNGSVYAISGKDESGNMIGSIERMEISNDDWKWETVSYSLPTPVASAFALPVDDGILVIGGEFDRKATDKIQVISFDDEKKKSFPALNRAVAGPGIIKVENQLLVFSGMMDDGTITNQSQITKPAPPNESPTKELSDTSIPEWVITVTVISVIVALILTICCTYLCNKQNGDENETDSLDVQMDDDEIKNLIDESSDGQPPLNPKSSADIKRSIANNRRSVRKLGSRKHPQVQKKNAEMQRI